MKGQILSMDFIISMVLYIFILSLSVMIWMNINTQIDESETNNAFYSNLVSVSDILIETAGMPSDWEKLNPQTDIDKINQIGLALSKNELSMDKILAFTKLPYTSAKNILGVKSRFVYIQFLDKNGNPLIVNGERMEFGLAPVNAENIYTISRLVIIEDGEKQNIGYMKVVMW
jgi:hypothetical protein